MIVQPFRKKRAELKAAQKAETAQAAEESDGDEEGWAMTELEVSTAHIPTYVDKLT